jgi:hypothetical protein
MVSSEEIDFLLFFCLGGIPSIKSATKRLHKIGFKGCLKNFQINSKFLDFDRDYIASQGTGNCSDT